jgi:hypothetical protein
MCKYFFYQKIYFNEEKYNIKKDDEDIIVFQGINYFSFKFSIKEKIDLEVNKFNINNSVYQ